MGDMKRDLDNHEIRKKREIDAESKCMMVIPSDSDYADIPSASNDDIPSDTRRRRSKRGMQRRVLPKQKLTPLKKSLLRERRRRLRATNHSPAFQNLILEM